MSFRSTGAKGSAGRERLNSWIRESASIPVRVAASISWRPEAISRDFSREARFTRSWVRPENARQDVVEDVADPARHVQEGLHLLVDGDPPGPRGQLVLRRLQLFEPAAETPELLLVDPRGVADHLAHHLAVDGHLAHDLHGDVADDLPDDLDRDLADHLAVDRHLPHHSARPAPPGPPRPRG